ncbi:MAG: class F sortase, partial [Actinomycetota bacterium]
TPRLAAAALAAAIGLAGCGLGSESSKVSAPVGSGEAVDATETPQAQRLRGLPASPELGEPLPPADGLPEAEPVVRPTALSLPTLGVRDAPVASVGVEPNGEMEIPDADEVGWYRYGPEPGNDGSAVLAAHIAADGVDGVFRDLERLDPGDPIEVVDDAGDAQPYLIVDVVEYDKQQLPFDAIFARDGAPRLVLITCGGDFNSELRSYDSNTVAYAVPAEEAALAALSALADRDTVIDRWATLGLD